MNGPIKIESARIKWMDKEFGDSVDIEAVLLENGWVYTPETDALHPDHTIDKISGVEVDE